MSGKSDDSIEKFFRKGLRQNDTTFREGDWLDLEKKLDEQVRIRAAARAKSLRQIVTAGTGILLIGVSLYFFVPGERSTVDGPQSTDNTAQIDTQAQPNNLTQESTVHSRRGRDETSPRSTVENKSQAGTQAQQIENRTEQTNKDIKPTAENTISTDTKALRADDRAKQTNSDIEPTAEKTASADTKALRAKDLAKQTNSNIKPTAENAASADSKALRAEDRAKQTNRGIKSTAENTASEDTKTVRVEDRAKQTNRNLKPTAGNTASADPKAPRAEDLAKQTNTDIKSTAENTVSADPKAPQAEDRTKPANRNTKSTVESAALVNAQEQKMSDRAAQIHSDAQSTAQNQEPKDTSTQGVDKTNSTDQNKQTAATSGAVDQEISTTGKPRQTERSGTPASPTPVTAAPTVANESERSGGEMAPATTPSAADSHTASSAEVLAPRQTERSATTALPTPDGQRASESSSPQTSSTETPSNSGSRGVGMDRELSTVDSSAADRGLVSSRPRRERTVDSTSHNDSASQEPTAEKEATKPPVRSRWNVALVVAPDFSSTGLGGEMSTPGTAYGGMIGFRVSRRLTITSGVIKSAKQYTGYGKDYEPPYGYWEKRTNGVVPDEIRGSCGIVEVPIAVQFDVRQGARSRLYVSGGLSSYFMRHEEYDYSFNEPNEGADRSWSSNTPSSYAFKVGQFSAAYEVMLTKNIGLSIEPYIKIPFQGIGWANLSLYTTGAYVNARYFFLKKK